MHMPSQLPLWARRKFRFQELVLNRGEEISGDGGGEMLIEEIQTRIIKDTASFSPRNTTQGDQVAPLEGHGIETDLGAVHSEEETQSEPVNKEGIAEEKNHSEDEDVEVVG